MLISLNARWFQSSVNHSLFYDLLLNSSQVTLIETYPELIAYNTTVFEYFREQ